MKSNRFVKYAAMISSMIILFGMIKIEPVRAQQPVNDELNNIQMKLDVGEQKVLDAENVRSFSEGVKGIIDVRLTKDNTQFVIVGLEPGKTTLLLIMLDDSRINYHVTVTDPEAPATKERQDVVTNRDNIRLDFYFVQLSNDYSHHVGIAWPGSLGGNATANIEFDVKKGKLTSATALVSDQVLPRLDLAQADGWAKIMRKAAVITANGSKANFSGGGEVNILVTGGFGGNIKQISYGSNIGVEPQYDKETGRIQLRITANVSDLASDNGTGVPGRTVSTLDTIVNLELGQSIVLAGLTAASETGSQAGLVGLSQIPILGVLFSSQATQVSESENVVFIVPTVLDTVALQKRSLIQEALHAYQEYSGDLNDVTALMPSTPTKDSL